MCPTPELFYLTSHAASSLSVTALRDVPPGSRVPRRRLAAFLRRRAGGAAAGDPRRPDGVPRRPHADRHRPDPATAGGGRRPLRRSGVRPEGGLDERPARDGHGRFRHRGGRGDHGGDGHGDRHLGHAQHTGSGNRGPGAGRDRKGGRRPPGGIHRRGAPSGGCRARDGCQRPSRRAGSGPVCRDFGRRFRGARVSRHQPRRPRPGHLDAGHRRPACAGRHRGERHRGVPGYRGTPAADHRNRLARPGAAHAPVPHPSARPRRFHPGLRVEPRRGKQPAPGAPVRFPRDHPRRSHGHGLRRPAGAARRLGGRGSGSRVQVARLRRSAGTGTGGGADSGRGRDPRMRLLRARSRGGRVLPGHAGRNRWPEHRHHAGGAARRNRYRGWGGRSRHRATARRAPGLPRASVPPDHPGA